MATWRQIKALLVKAGIRFGRGVHVEERDRTEVFAPMALYIVDPDHPDQLKRLAFLPFNEANALSPEPAMDASWNNEVVYPLLVERLGMDPQVTAAGLDLTDDERLIIDLRHRQRAQPALLPEGDDSALDDVVFLGTINDSSSVIEDDPDEHGMPSMASAEWSDSEASDEWEIDEDPR